MTRAFAVLLLALALIGGGAAAQTLSDAMAGVAFLIGDWTGGGRSLDGMTASGSSSIHLIVGGNALLRRDHNELTDANGKLQQSFDQIMLIYPEGGTLRADYLDGAHTIHYTKATVEPGESVQFEGADALGTLFRLTYRKTSADTLSVTFDMQRPGAANIVLVASGTLTRK